MDITVCIPTFNRPESLDRVLQHLLHFRSKPSEVVIGDNSGTGSAISVANKYKDQFPSLVYLNRPFNVGATQNMDSIARIGTTPYIYILSDDDFVYESALVTMKNILDNNPDIAAVNGEYEGTRVGIIGLDKDISNSIVSRIPKGGFEQLWNNFDITDNHPLMRRIDFNKHTRYREISCAVAPVIFDLLAHGDFIHMHCSVLQHEQRLDSISSRIASHEVTDLVNGDLEIISCKANLLAHEAATVRGRTLSNVYFQGARVLFSSGKYLAGWHSLMRSNAYLGVENSTKIWLEKNLLPKLLSEKIIQIAADTGCVDIHGDSIDINHTWISNLNTRLAIHPNQVPTDNACKRSLLLTTASEVLPKSTAEVIVSIPSLISQFALTGYAIGFDVTGDFPRITSQNQAWVHMDETNQVQIAALQTPYA